MTTGSNRKKMKIRSKNVVNGSCDLLLECSDLLRWELPHSDDILEADAK